MYYFILTVAQYLVGFPPLPTIAITAADRNGSNPHHCISAVESAGGQVRIVTPDAAAPDALAGVGGLLIADDGSHANGGQADATAWSAPLLLAALAVDMPVLATGSGMHLLNAGFGGDRASTIDRHYPADESEPLRHQIYLSPGSKVAAIIGSAGMFRVNSRHSLGLREPQRAIRLMSIAYQLDDGVIEGLESKEHSWVIGVQFLPERADELPASFNNLFLGLVERADEFAGNSLSTSA